MANISEKRYYIDPGEGEKRYTCPYSCYEDGRDAKQDVIPPKGYVLKGFRFEPHSSDKYYDGRLIAEYEKAPLSMRLEQNKWKYLIALIVIGVILAILYFLGVSSKPKPSERPPLQPLVVTDSIASDAIIKSDSSVVMVSDTATITTDNTKDLKNEPNIESPVAQMTKDSAAVEEQKQNSAQTQETDLPTDAQTIQFKQEFWNMIYNKNSQMNSYDALFNKYKGTVKCKEYDYLRGTILQNTTAFKSWKGKLLSIPASELQTINTIDVLKQKLK